MAPYNASRVRETRLEGRAQGLYFRVQPRRLMKRHMVKRNFIKVKSELVVRTMPGGHAASQIPHSMHGGIYIRNVLVRLECFCRTDVRSEAFGTDIPDQAVGR